VKARPHEEKPCKQCGGMIVPKPRAGGGYSWKSFDRKVVCSPVCSGVFRTLRSYTEKPCAHCGEMFGPKRVRQGPYYEWRAFDDALFCSPKCNGAQRMRRLNVRGVYLSTYEIAALLGIARSSVMSRLSRGLDPLAGKKFK
jgi:hypothetical protein